MTHIGTDWYTKFFNEDYIEIYSERLSRDATERETAFVVDALGLRDGDRVLDLACGHGRHAVALAQRGMVVTGQDLNEDYLRMAREDAARAGVEIETVHGDMREIPFTDEFDAVINMFTAFGYFDSEDEDVRVLEAVANALESGGKLLLDTINGSGCCPTTSRTTGTRTLMAIRTSSTGSSTWSRDATGSRSTLSRLTGLVATRQGMMSGCTP